MIRLFLFLCIVASLIFSMNLVLHPVFSDELDDLNKKINELQDSLRMSQKATAPLESQLNNMKKQIAGIEERVVFIEQDIKQKRKYIEKGYKDLIKQKDIFNKAVRDYYIKNYFFSPLLVFVSNTDAGDITRILAYQKKGAEQDKALITNTALKLTDLEERKATLEEEEKRLASVKTKLAAEKQEVEKVVLGAKQYQTTLSHEIAALTTRQQEIIAQKQASLNLPRSASITTGCVDDRDINPGFSPRFAFFTYGIPHRVGMNQWGAYGRAKAGQDYRTILNAYYNNVRVECRNFPSGNIKVQGYGEKSIVDYLKGLGEMPESWGNEGGYEALKAQVVAAASYAYSYTGGGSGEICTTQSCQVYLGHNKGGRWDAAVDDIKGKCGDGVEMLVSNDTGEVIKAWYASTFGGYTFNSGDVFEQSKPWTKRSQDTTSEISGGDGFSVLAERAYDKASPYFYCDWGTRREYNKTAWLKSDEVADIVNVILLAKSDSGTVSHLAQPDKPNPDGVDTWDASRVKQELRARSGSPYNSVDSLSVDWDRGTGRTTTATVSGDAGSNSFDGNEFRNFFNLRAPSNIQIVGPLYNVEKR